jgi:glycosyltransferase A (GT-A) superfamily protein (DUF2064 family)
VSNSIESSPQIVRGQSDGSHTLVIMAKAPKPGLVKTRLARSLPGSAVTAFYRCLLDDTLTLARSLHGVKVAVMSPAADREDLEHTVGSAVPVVPQVGNGLSAAPALGLSVRLTDPFYDIDEAADLSRLAEELQLMPGRAPKTAKWLSEWASAGHIKKAF